MQSSSRRQFARHRLLFRGRRYMALTFTQQTTRDVQQTYPFPPQAKNQFRHYHPKSLNTRSPLTASIEAPNVNGAEFQSSLSYYASAEESQWGGIVDGGR